MIAFKHSIISIIIILLYFSNNCAVYAVITYFSIDICAVIIDVFPDNKEIIEISHALIRESIKNNSNCQYTNLYNYHEYYDIANTTKYEY